MINVFQLPKKNCNFFCVNFHEKQPSAVRNKRNQSFAFLSPQKNHPKSNYSNPYPINISKSNELQMIFPI